ncbi:helix-turn-helix domain-containing protein [Micromonospora pisi]|uniref:helix-turn-helix domain-containing protein n=1 Tax=Micromonospora pisi TaxID=589240 RepID=UPI0014771829|nr:helix-turn-helix transcriptional regulator [Micromonospora pisi]
MTDSVSTSRATLGDFLTRAREARGFTRTDVARHIGCTLGKITGIERGEVRTSIPDLRALLEIYQVTDPQTVADLTELARATRRPSPQLGVPVPPKRGTSEVGGGTRS